MTVIRKIALCTVLVLTAALETACSGRMVFADDDLGKVLAKLDASAKTFTSAQADIVWDNVQTQPVLDKDSQVGMVVFAHAKNGQMQVAVHIKTDNGKPVLKDLSYADGIGKMYEPAIKQLQVFKVGDKGGQLESFLTLGFGGSGQDLTKNWQITDAGTEAVNGVQAAKLLLVPRDPALAKTAPKVLLWIDLDKGVAVKQQRFDTAGNYVIFTYNNIQLNKKIPSNAFEIKTASGTQVVNH
jgi:outer membrane lipoprotein-sorting protein